MSFKIRRLTAEMSAQQFVRVHGAASADSTLLTLERGTIERCLDAKTRLVSQLPPVFTPTCQLLLTNTSVHGRTGSVTCHWAPGFYRRPRQAPPDSKINKPPCLNVTGTYATTKSNFYCFRVNESVVKLPP